jgi:glucokinase
MTALLGDIGGTNARFAIGGSERGEFARTYRCADFRDLESIVASYLGTLPDDVQPRNGAIAVAGPVKGPKAEMTNLPWSIDADRIRQHSGLEFLFLVNDFSAQAMAVPLLSPEDIHPLDSIEPEPGAAIAVIGPGTGLGVSALVPAEDGRWMPLTTEGGHVTMASRTDEEASVIEVLTARFEHVSAERVVSGQGIENIHSALCEIDGVEDPQLAAAEIADLAVANGDDRAARTLDLFCGFLATAASDLALTIGARGGVYIAGGIPPRFPGLIAASGFRERFNDKGRFRDWLSSVPLRIVMHPRPAFLGLSALVQDRMRRH